MDDWGIEQDYLWVHCDSMSDVYLAKNQIYHARSKHIDVKYHFVRDVLENGDIEVKKIQQKTIPQTYLQRWFPESSSIIEKTCFEPSGCLSSVELIWMNYEWLDLLGRGT